MHKMITASVAASAFALGLTVPSSAAPVATAPRAATPIADTSHGTGLTMDERGVVRRDPNEAKAPRIPPRVEGIAGGYVFVPITPYRTLDTRTFGIDGFMLGGDEQVFSVLVDENNVPMLPEAAVAVTYNLTVTSTLGAGFCALYPGSFTWPGNSSINWTATSQTLANGGTVAIDFYTRPGQVSIYCGPAANLGAHFVLDITGYYI